MSHFLALERAQGFVIYPSEENLLYPDAENEQQALMDSMEAYPVLQHAFRSRSKGSCCLKERYQYYKAKPASAVRRAFLRLL